MKKRALIVGSGGREHALAWKIRQSPLVEQVFVAPGNGGTQTIAQNVPIPATAVGELAQFAKANQIDLTVVEQDDVLALGIVDVFMDQDLPIFGPSRAATAIESSKTFAKRLMTDAGIATASYRAFRHLPAAIAYARGLDYPLVVKDSSLAKGKGVDICQNFDEAEKALTKHLVTRGCQEVIVEEFLAGQELSIHALCDGQVAIMFPPSHDYKRIGDGDQGPNTGGMGSVVPVPWVTDDLMAQIRDQVVQPALEALISRCRWFSGCLYPGVMINPNGIKTLEFNARFGDPETQSYLRLLESDLFELLFAVANGDLLSVRPRWRPGFAICVVLASADYGYSSQLEVGLPIDGIEAAQAVPGVVVFQAGTTFTDRLQTSGGRVLNVTAIGDTLPEAIERVYQGVGCISFSGMHYRRDIGAKLLSGF